jgi:hypothetical protein
MQLSRRRLLAEQRLDGSEAWRRRAIEGLDASFRGLGARLCLQREESVNVVSSGAPWRAEQERQQVAEQRVDSPPSPPPPPFVFVHNTMMTNTPCVCV